MIGHSSPTLEKLPYIRTMHNKHFNNLGTLVPTMALALGALCWYGPARGQAPAAGTQAPAAQPVAPASKAAQGGAPGVPGEPAQEPPTEAERLIDLAIKQVAGLKSVSADVTQRVEMLKQK